MNAQKKKKQLKNSTKLILAFLGVSLFIGVLWVNWSTLAPIIQAQEELENEVIIIDAPERVYTKTELLVIGARKDALAMPAYVNAYYAGGYPPEDEGTCTDLVWRAFLEAGYVLKDAVDEDIRLNRSAYPNIPIRDPNIDFRRVQNLKVFLERHAIKLTNDVYQTDQWQAGDIVIFGKNEHIGIVSDIRNVNDIPYLIHNNDQPLREEDRLEYGSYTMGITGHYRFVFPDN